MRGQSLFHYEKRLFVGHGTFNAMDVPCNGWLGQFLVKELIMGQRQYLRLRRGCLVIFG
jgi:hypothetical protein